MCLMMFMIGVVLLPRPLLNVVKSYHQSIEYNIADAGRHLDKVQ